MSKINEEIVAQAMQMTAQINAQAAPPSPEPATMSRGAQRAERAKPLHERLRAALDKFPAEVLANGLHMNQINPLTLGAQRSKPRPFETAQALATLGWVKVRLYQTNASTTIWFPPNTPVAEGKRRIKERA